MASRAATGGSTTPVWTVRKPAARFRLLPRLKNNTIWVPSARDNIAKLRPPDIPALTQGTD